jgi:hypothetical protein
MFFGACLLVIVTCFMVPRMFGLQFFTQWGGMYTDGWCSVEASDVRTATAEERGKGGVTERILAGDIATWKLVWFPPMHRADTCVAWAHSWCGKKSPKGMTIVSTFPYYRGQFLADGLDVCQLRPDPAFRWFSRP